MPSCPARRRLGQTSKIDTTPILTEYNLANSLRRSVPGARSCAAPPWVETSIEPLTPVAASVNRLREVDYLSQALGDV